MPTSRSRGSVAAVVLLLIAAARLPARAQQPAPVPLQPGQDLVTLANGDRLKGEIKGLSRGRLSFDIKAAGVISIKWDHVRQLTSDRLFLVETNEGAHLLGTLPAAEAGKVAVATTADRWDFDVEAVVALAPIHRSFFQRLDGSINLGGSYTQASGVAQLSATFNVRARRPQHEWRASAEDYVTFESDGATSERFRAGLAYSRDVTGRWAVWGGGQVERNPDLGFDFRATAAGGLERTILRTNRSALVTGAGLGASREVPVDAASETLLPMLLTLRHSFFTHSTPKTSLDTNFAAYPILNQSGRWRLEATSSVSREILKDFTVALTFYESYDNRPPSAEAKKNDAGVTLSIGFTF